MRAYRPIPVEHALAGSFGRQWNDALARSCMGTGLPNTIRTMREARGIPLSDADGVERPFVSGYSSTVVPNLWDRSAEVRKAVS